MYSENKDKSKNITSASVSHLDELIFTESWQSTSFLKNHVHLNNPKKVLWFTGLRMKNISSDSRSSVSKSSSIILVWIILTQCDQDAIEHPTGRPRSLPSKFLRSWQLFLDECEHNKFYHIRLEFMKYFSDDIRVIACSCRMISIILLYSMYVILSLILKIRLIRKYERISFDVRLLSTSMKRSFFSSISFRIDLRA